MTDQDDTLFDFPCEFPIKIMGKASDEFEVAVYGIVRKHFTGIAQDALKSRPSADGKYLAITVTVTAHSRAQLDAVYIELNNHELVIMTL